MPEVPPTPAPRTPTPPPHSGNKPTTRIAVIGGGISGLAAAHRLGEIRPECEVQVLEASPQLGGVLQTVRQGDYLIETAADNFITKLPWAEELCERLGLADELLPTEPSLRKALVVSRGKIEPVPQAFVLMSAGKLWPLVTTPILSLPGKLRLALEPLVARRRDPSDPSDESVASFVRRRLGNEAFERLVQPLVAGIYTADPERLSMRAAMPKYFEQEQQYGSLWRGRRLEKSTTESGARYGAFVAPKLGMGQLVTTLAERLPQDAIKCNTPVRSVMPAGSAWRVELADGQSSEYTGVVLATPAPHVAESVNAFAPELAASLGKIEYSSVAIAVLAVARRDIAKPLRGFGFVVPSVERRRIIAASFASLKFPGRAPDDQVLVRVFIGGALQPELLEGDDKQLISLAREELGDLIGLGGEPAYQSVFRWPASMPQYHLGHHSLVDRIEQLVAQQPGLELAGNAYRGVGIPQCIRSGELAAERILSQLS